MKKKLQFKKLLMGVGTVLSVGILSAVTLVSCSGTSNNQSPEATVPSKPSFVKPTSEQIKTFNANSTIPYDALGGLGIIYIPAGLPEYILEDFPKFTSTNYTEIPVLIAPNNLTYGLDAIFAAFNAPNSEMFSNKNHADQNYTYPYNYPRNYPYPHIFAESSWNNPIVHDEYTIWNNAITNESNSLIKSAINDLFNSFNQIPWSIDLDSYTSINIRSTKYIGIKNFTFTYFFNGEIKAVNYPEILITHNESLSTPDLSDNNVYSFLPDITSNWSDIANTYLISKFHYNFQLVNEFKGNVVNPKPLYKYVDGTPTPIN